MSELYPSDQALLELEQDPDTGVELIPTGRSPYYLEFRRLVQRLLLATRRANDFRVYADGPLSVGVRPGSCFLGTAPVVFVGTTGVVIPDNATTQLWLTAAGAVQIGSSLPADRATFLPLAAVVAASGSIAALTDLRGQAFLSVPSLPLLGVTALADEINTALDGVNGSVTAAALNTLTGGAASDADALHRHSQYSADQDSEIAYRLINPNSGTNAGIALRFELPGKPAGTTALLPDSATGWLRQRHGSDTLALVGTVHAHYGYSGAMLTSQTGRVMGAAPISGVVRDVVLTAGRNIESLTPTDNVTATVKKNGAAVCATNPTLAATDGTGFRSTAQGHGTPAVVKTDGTQNVLKGDLLTVDLTRTLGAPLVDPADLAVIVVIRPDKPE